MPFSLPPVRGVVSLGRDSSVDARGGLAALFRGRQLHLHQSGTAALAVALLDAKLRQRAAAPEAIVPAYGCPQLVAACLHAGVRPRLVDTVAGGWGYDLPQLRAALSADCVAVLAVNLLGTGDQVEEILPLARASGALVIQDSAQHLPTAPTEWPGDYVVLSFGRGKPLNLLRGGALAVPDARPPRRRIRPRAEVSRGTSKAAAVCSRAAGILFNTVTHPAVLWTGLRGCRVSAWAQRAMPAWSGYSAYPGRSGGSWGLLTRRPRASRGSPIGMPWRRIGSGWVSCA